MLNYLGMMAEGDNSGIWLIIIMAVFLVLILVTSYLPQKKRQKEMMNMLSNLTVGDEIKTIGGMIGKITAIEESGLLVINVGTEENPTLIKIDKVAIYSVARKPEAQPVEPVAEAKEEAPAETEENK